MSGEITWCLSSRCVPRECIHYSGCPFLKSEKRKFRVSGIIFVLFLFFTGFLNSHQKLGRMTDFESPVSPTVARLTLDKVDAITFTTYDNNFAGSGNKDDNYEEEEIKTAG